jgi:dTDP-4-amino-4,6-dideoxygalactose transaminase
VGLNSRLDELQAVVLNARLKCLDAWNDERRRLAAVYDERLAKVDEVTIPTVASGCGHVYHQYVIRAERRDALRAHLDDAGIGARVFYPLPLHLQECFRSLGYAKGDLPEAERAAAEVLSLPMFPGLTDEEQDGVAGAIESFYSG